MAAVLRHMRTSSTLGNPGKNFNALRTQLDILFIIHKLWSNKRTSSVCFYSFLLSYYPIGFTMYFSYYSYIVSVFYILLLSFTVRHFVMSDLERITWMVTVVPEAMCTDFRKSTCSMEAQCCNFQHHRANDLHWPNTEFTCACYTSFLLYYITLMQCFDWRKRDDTHRCGMTSVTSFYIFYYIRSLGLAYPSYRTIYFLCLCDMSHVWYWYKLTCIKRRHVAGVCCN